MSKTFIKIKSFDIDHENNQTFVRFHEWDGKYFCASCALEVKEKIISGSFWNSPDEVKNAVLNQVYGYDITSTSKR